MVSICAGYVDSTCLISIPSPVDLLCGHGEAYLLQADVGQSGEGGT